MASLALALGLADVVTAESGGVQIDSLFVDEGFGTLDPQALDAVMNVLDELRRGGRTVGVISHVEELRTRITSRLEGVPGAESLYRLVTTLLDPVAAPAAELAALYHERWESEGAFAELKVSLPGERLMLRSRRADLVEQEVYGLLLVHLALRQLMYEASRQNGCDPDQLSFLHTVRVVRRHLPFHAAFSPSAAPADAADGADRDPRRAGRAKPRPAQPTRGEAQDEQLSNQGPGRTRRTPAAALP